MKYFFAILYLTIACSKVLSEEVKIQPCPDTVSQTCELKKVTLDPCPEAALEQNCILYRGTNVTWHFTIDPKFNSDKLNLTVGSYTAGQPDQDATHLDNNACSYTTCPIVSGKQFTIIYPTRVQEDYPAAPFNVKWKFTTPNKDHCCFLIPIVIQ